MDAKKFQDIVKPGDTLIWKDGIPPALVIKRAKFLGFVQCKWQKAAYSSDFCNTKCTGFIMYSIGKRSNVKCMRSGGQVLCEIEYPLLEDDLFEL